MGGEEIRKANWEEVESWDGCRAVNVHRLRNGSERKGKGWRIGMEMGGVRRGANW